MKNLFLKSQIEYLIDEGVEEEENSLTRHKTRNRYMSLIITFIFILFLYTGYLINISYNLPEYARFFYMLIACLIILVIFLVIVIMFKHKKRLLITFKWIVAVVFYVIQVYWTFMVITERLEHRFIRCFYVLQLNSYLYSLVFVKMHFAYIITTALINISITIYVQISNIFPGSIFSVEIMISFIVPVAAILTRLQYEHMIKTLYIEIKKNRKFSKYIDNLIYELPSFFIIFTKDKIVNINSDFEKFLSKYTGEESNDVHSQRKNESISIVVHPSTEDYHARAQKFLERKKISYLDPPMQELLEEEAKNENIFNILNMLLTKNNLAEGKFFFLGIICNINNEEKNQYNFHFRKMSTSKTSWIEVTLSDVTVSQKVKLIENIQTIRENLLSKIAHEFKTPLICVTSLTDEISSELSSQNIDEDVLRKVRDVSNLSSYTLFLINDVVNFLTRKRNCEKKISKKEKIYLADIVKFAYEILNTLVRYNKDKIKFISTSVETTIDAVINSEPFRVKQILLNIISNAVKFTKSGLIKIAMRYEEPNVLISIQDTGMGIAEEDLKKIFSQEVMLETHIKENEMGSGLGLSICNQLANLCGFKLLCESQESVGSNFKILIPVEKDDVLTGENHMYKEFKEKENYDKSRDHRSLSEITKKMSESQINHILSNIHKLLNNKNEIEFDILNQRKILLIDDNSIILDSMSNLFKSALKRNGINDIDIITGFDGVDLLVNIIEDQKRGNKIVLSVIDENMEYVNGSEALDVIRNLEKKKRIKRNFICNMSAAGELNLGMYDYSINKPANVNEVETLLKIINII